MIAEKEYTILLKEFLNEKNIRPSKIKIVEDNGLIMIFVRAKDIPMSRAVDLSFEATGKLCEETGEEIAVNIIPM